MKSGRLHAPAVKAPGTKRLQLTYDKLLSYVPFGFNLRRYTAGELLVAIAGQSGVLVLKPASSSMSTRAGAGVMNTLAIDAGEKEGSDGASAGDGAVEMGWIRGGGGNGPALQAVAGLALDSSGQLHVSSGGAVVVFALPVGSGAGGGGDGAGTDG